MPPAPPEKSPKKHRDMTREEMANDPEFQKLQEVDGLFDTVVDAADKEEKILKDEVLFRSGASARHEVAEKERFKSALEKKIYNKTKRDLVPLASQVMREYLVKKGKTSPAELDETEKTKLKEEVKYRISQFYESVRLLLLLPAGESMFGIEQLTAVLDNPDLLGEANQLDEDDRKLLQAAVDQVPLSKTQRDHLINKILTTEAYTPSAGESLQFKDGYCGFVVKYLSFKEKVALFERMPTWAERPVVADIMDAYLTTDILSSRAAQEIIERIGNTGEFDNILVNIENGTYQQHQAEVEAKIKEQIDELKKADPTNPFWKYFTVENIIMAEIIGRWGMLTAVVNGVAGWKNCEFLKNPYFWGGLAVMAGTAEYVTGGTDGTGEIAGVITKPSKETLRKAKEKRRVAIFKDYYNNYPDLSRYFYENFEAIQEGYSEIDKERSDIRTSHFEDEEFNILSLEEGNPDGLPPLPLSTSSTINGLTLEKAEEYATLMYMIADSFECQTQSQLDVFIQDHIHPYHKS